MAYVVEACISYLDFPWLIKYRVDYMSKTEIKNEEKKAKS